MNTIVDSRGADVVLRNVQKNFAGVPAVSDLSLDIAPGEFMTFLGPSGSGKTTTLNMIAGFTQIDGGSIRVSNEETHGLPPHKRNMGVVFQNYALFPHMTAVQNVAFPLRQRGVNKVDALSQARACLGDVKLDRYADRYPSQLSGGQQQRVALARAIVFRPRVLLMDEPLGALDRALREQMQLEIKRLHREVESTVVFVTHDQEEALALSDRIAVFESGNISQVGTARELYEKPETFFVAGFLGESLKVSGTVESKNLVVSACGSFRCETRSIAIGSQVAIVIRPENVKITPVSLATNSALTGVQAKVLDEVYLGTGRKIVVQLADGSEGIVREPASTMSNVRRDDVVNLFWEVPNTHVVAL